MAVILTCKWPSLKVTPFKMAAAGIDRLSMIIEEGARKKMNELIQRSKNIERFGGEHD